MGRRRGGAATSVAERAGCVVSAWRAGRPEAGARSCSGVALRRRPGLVLCHGGVLLPFLRAGGRALAAAEGSALPADCCGRDLRLRVRWGPAPAAPGAGKGAGARSRLPAAGPALRSARCAGPGLAPAPRRPRGRPAELLLLLSCPAFRAHFARLFGPDADGDKDRDQARDRAQAGRWRFAGGDEDEDEAGAGDEEPAQLRALGWFALLRVCAGEEDSEDSDPDPGLAVAPLGALGKGAPLLACASPFGASCPDLFLNTLSRGVLSNAAGPLLLTDARCLPGSEGGGVFALGAPGPAETGIAETGTPAPGTPGLDGALVAAPLCWRAGEWVGLSLLCAAAPLLAALRPALARLRPRDGPALAALLPPEAAALDTRTPATPGPPWAAAALLVECGAVWGSGVALAPRLVLTCRHVAPRPGAPVLVRAPHGDAPE